MTPVSIQNIFTFFYLLSFSQFGLIRLDTPPSHACAYLPFQTRHERNLPPRATDVSPSVRPSLSFSSFLPCLPVPSLPSFSVCPYLPRLVSSLHYPPSLPPSIYSLCFISHILSILTLSLLSFPPCPQRRQGLAASSAGQLRP